MTSLYSQFLYGFARGADIDRAEAESTWAAWSAQLSDMRRRAIERDGEDAGFTEGQRLAAFMKINPSATVEESA